jgi:autotransporter passenger strand-loop-strand repeat protein
VVVLSGGTLDILSGGTASSTVVSNGGSLAVASGGLADPTTIYSGGSETISKGGTDLGAPRPTQNKFKGFWGSYGRWTQARMCVVLWYTFIRFGGRRSSGWVGELQWTALHYKNSSRKFAAPRPRWMEGGMVIRDVTKEKGCSPRCLVRQ